MMEKNILTHKHKQNTYPCTHTHTHLYEKMMKKEKP